jgi:hypothetical protein
MNSLSFSSAELRSGPAQVHTLSDVEIRTYRTEKDAKLVRRMGVRLPGDISAEFLLTKGFSIGAFTVDGRPVFWDPPYDGLLDPDSLDLRASMLINGVPMPGFQYVRNFAGGIELLGLQNWGMPVADQTTGELQPLHGEAANIPVEFVEIAVESSSVVFTAGFTLRGVSYVDDKGKPWYARGEPLWQVTREIRISSDQLSASMHILDSFANLSDKRRKPDWGYHFQFYAEDGARLEIPHRTAAIRGGGELPPEFDTWRPALDPQKRVERGVIYKNCKTRTAADGSRTIPGRVCYADGRVVEFSLPEAPYVQGWFSCGGSESSELKLSDQLGNDPIMQKPWNGLGPEIGSSALDHDGDVDASVIIPEIEPGEATTLSISIEPQWSAKR